MKMRCSILDIMELEAAMKHPCRSVGQTGVQSWNEQVWSREVDLGLVNVEMGLKARKVHREEMAKGQEHSSGIV